MGYYTFHELSIYKDDKLEKEIDFEKEEEIKEELGKSTGYLDSLFEDTIKWYDHDKDMIEISKKYHDYVFVLTGDGECSDDFWRTYYKNGKTQKVGAELVYGNYSPKKLN